MAMHNPPHPGEFITEVYLKPNNLSARELAAKLGVAASTLHRIVIGSSSVSLKWPCGYRKLWDGQLRVGCPYSTTMIFGEPRDVLTSKT
jgi:helix-turn-helix protein